MDNSTINSSSHGTPRRILEFDGHPVIVEVGVAAFDAISPELHFHMRGAHGIILVYNTNSDASFRSLFSLARALEKQPSSPPLMALIGNKKDYLAPSEVSSEVGQQLARQHGMHFIEGSIHDVRHLEAAFTGMVRELWDKRPASDDAPVQKRPKKPTSSNSSPPRKSRSGFFAALRRKLGLSRRRKESFTSRGLLKKRGPAPDFEEPQAKRVDLKLDLDLGDRLDGNGVYENTIRRYR